jgi:glycosyltransferase involved in cell wall biosynthesis
MTGRSSVSVIVPCHDASATLARSLDSVARQTKPPVEVILVNDASSDATGDVMRELAGRPWPFTLRLASLPENRGPGEARNAGWAMVDRSIRYIAFLDADDLWRPWKLERQIGWMECHAEIDWTAHRCGVLGRDLAPEPIGDTPRATRLSRSRLLVRNFVATPAVVVRATVAERFRPGWRWSEDLMLWLDWLDRGHTAAFLDDTLAFLGRPPMSPGGATGHRRRMFAGELRVIDTLVRERRMTPLLGYGWRAFAAARYLRRLVIS